VTRVKPIRCRCGGGPRSGEMGMKSQYAVLNRPI